MEEGFSKEFCIEERDMGEPSTGERDIEKGDTGEQGIGEQGTTEEQITLKLVGIRTDYQRKYARVACVMPASCTDEVHLKATTRLRLPLRSKPILLCDSVCESACDSVCDSAFDSVEAQLDGAACVTCGQARIDAVDADAQPNGVVRVVYWSVPFQYSRLGLHLVASAGRGIRALRASLDIAPDVCQKELVAWMEERRNCQNWDGYNEWMRANRASAEELAREREVVSAWEKQAEAVRVVDYTARDNLAVGHTVGESLATELAAHESAEAEATSQSFLPRISFICPAYETPETYLRTMLDSILAQTYTNWELVLADASTSNAVQRVLATYHDKRIRSIAIENVDIATNTNCAIEAADGDYLAFIDHDDFIEPDCLFRYVEAIRATPTADLLFCNEDMWEDQANAHEQVADDDQTDAHERAVSDQALGTYDEVAQATGTYFGPKFKGGFDLARELDGNVVCHMLMVSRRVMDACELTPSELAGAQDYDLTFKAYEVARHVSFVPHMLYHWRSHQQSSAMNEDDKPYLFEAGRSAVQQHLERRNIQATVASGSYRLTYKTTFKVDESPLDVALVRVSDKAGTASWAERVHAGVVKSSSRYILVLDEGATPLSDELVQALVGYLQLSEVGIAAPLILDADGLVQSCGLSIAANGEPVAMSCGLAPVDTGYMQFLQCAHVVTAVPSTCVAFRREVFDDLGGFDLSFRTDMALVDFCLRLRECGLISVVDPRCSIVRHPRQVERTQQEGLSLLQEGLSLLTAHKHDMRRLLELHPSLETAEPTLDSSLMRGNAYYKLAGMQ